MKSYVNIKNFNKLMSMLKPNLYYPVLVVYGVVSAELDAAKKLLSAAGIEYKIKKHDTSKIGRGPIPVPGKSSLNPDVLPAVRELALYVKGKDLKRSRRLLATLQKSPRRDWRFWIRICGVALFVTGLIALPLLWFADLILVGSVLFFALGFIGQKPKYQSGKYIFVKCTRCGRINYVQLDKKDKAICGACKSNLYRAIERDKL